jgi:hypothetical protein
VLEPRLKLCDACTNERLVGGVSGDVMGVARDVVLRSEVPLYRACE